MPFQYSTIVCACHFMFHFAPLSQYGNTAVLCAAFEGDKDLVQDLCETFEADFLHKNKVRAMRTMGDTEWLSELCVCVASM